MLYASGCDKRQLKDSNCNRWFQMPTTASRRHAASDRKTYPRPERVTVEIPLDL